MTNPSIWIVLAAVVALLIGLLSWGVFGTVSTSVSATGVKVDGKAMCLLSAEKAAEVAVGNTANVGGEIMTVSSISNVPASRDEIRELVKSDYLVSTLVEGDWAYVVRFDGNVSGLGDGLPLSIEITTKRISPIDLLLGGLK